MEPTEKSETIWADPETSDGAASNARLVKMLEDDVKAGRKLRVLARLRGWSPADILSCLMQMRTKRARKVFEWLPDDVGLPVLVELDPDLRSVLFEAATRSKFRKLILKASPDRALETLEALPDDTADALVAGRKDAEDMRAILAARRDTAAAHMRHGALTIPVGWTVGDVIEDIRRRSPDLGALDAMFVVDADQRLQGYLRSRDLVLNAPDIPVADILRTDTVTVTGETDQEDVLDLAEAKGVTQIAVVDRDGRFLGGIAPPELSEIIWEEVEEDMLKMGGVSPESTQFDNPLEIVKRRLPWLLGGLVGASVAAAAIVSYEDALAETAILASFIPVVLATAGNAGIQASTVSVQTLTSGTEWQGDLGARFVRELGGAALNGMLVGMAVGLLILLASLVITLHHPLWLAATGVTALTIVTVIAASVGSMVPFVLRWLKMDPAAATGIFITTSNDVFGVLTFFSVASWLYL